MQCDDVEHVIEESGSLELPEAARSHLAGCSSCAALVHDFQTIISTAHQIPAEVEPPARIWVALRAQLEAEGIIRKPEVPLLPKPASWWQGLSRMLLGHRLATASAAALLFAVGVFFGTGPRFFGPSKASPEPFAEAATTLDQEERSLGPIQNASTMSVSSVDSSLRENLSTVNAFIKECRKRLAEDPNDQMARDYLSTAYQQKAEILAAMMERGRSVN